METFEFQGLQIKYARAGKGAPMVFLHNGGTSHTIWKDVTPKLASSFEIFALDLLGYGASSKPASGYSLDRYVDILEAFLAHHKLDNVTLVGNCMGSAMSIAYAMRRPAGIRALVLINPLTSATFTAGWLGSLLRLRRAAPGLSRTVYGGLGRFRLNRWIGEQSLRMQFGTIGQARHLEKTDDLCACFTGQGQMNSLLGALDDLVHYAVFDTFTPPAGFPPVCTIWGLENKILSAKAGRALNATLRPAREEWLTGCGHLAMLEKPDEIANTIREFVALQGVRA
jgi:pimeloyl-ACP methyl ester carboxylesterase